MSHIKDFCQSYGAELKFNLIAHPQTNGFVEVTNQVIFKGLKKWATRSKGTCVNKLSCTLWASRMTPKHRLGELSFSITFGTKAIMPPEIVFSIPWVKNFDDKTFKDEL